MKLSTFCVLISLVILFIFSIILSGFAYQQNKVILQNQQKIINQQYAYLKLQRQFVNYQAEHQNTRQFINLANNQQSKHNIIADILYRYSTSVKGDLSIYYKNLATGESVIIDGDRKYYMASLYKVILTLYMLDTVKSGTISLIDKVGNPPIQLKQALNKIISESNNEYAISLAETYGWENIEQSMKPKLGIDLSFNSDLQTNVKNVGQLFEEITLALNIPDWESNYLLALLKDQKKVSKLPKYLPKNVISHNKTGEFDNYSHDAGIFYTPKANYILVFMSKTDNPDSTNEQMALMSKEVYEKLNDIEPASITSENPKP